MVFCVEKYVVLFEDDDRWFYFFVFDLVKCIVVGDKWMFFVGFYFFYEDVLGRVMKEDNFILFFEIDFYFVLRVIFINLDSVEFFYYIVEIDKVIYLFMLINFYKGE